MALCKSTRCGGSGLMAFPTTHSQRTPVFHNRHYASQMQSQGNHPDRPIGFGAFGVVW